MIDLTAKGSGYYLVQVAGVTKSQHVAEREAIEAASALVSAGTQEVTYTHDYVVDVRYIEGTGTPPDDPSTPVSPPVDPPKDQNPPDKGGDDPVSPPDEDEPPATDPPVTVPPDAPVAGQIGSADLTYLGHFSAPAKPTGGKYGFDYSVGIMTLGPAADTIYLSNHVYEQKVAELTIPAIGGTAVQVQQLGDLFSGHMDDVATTPYKTQLGGMLVDGGGMLLTAYGYYDAGHKYTKSTFIRDSLSTLGGGVAGPYALGPLDPAFYAGYMCHVPEKWQAALGGRCLTGLGGVAIVARTSWGPALFAWDPDAPENSAQPLVYYTGAHPTLGVWSHDQAPNPAYNLATNPRGCAFIDDSVLVFGRTGLGKSGYGIGTKDQSLDGTNEAAGVKYCYDPVNSAKGTHAYPYACWVWAYKASDLADAAAGKVAPWEVLPYAQWQLPFLGAKAQCGSAAYDPVARRLYVAEAFGEAYSHPVIHVFEVK